MTAIRRLSWIVGACMNVLFGAAPALAQSTDIASAVRAVRGAVARALTERDRAGLDTLVSATFRLTHTDGGLDDRATWLAKAAAGRLGIQLGSLRVLEETIDSLGSDGAIRTLVGWIRRPTGPDITETWLRGVELYGRIDGRWRLTYMQSTLIFDGRVFDTLPDLGLVGDYRLPGGRWSVLVRADSVGLHARLPNGTQARLIRLTNSRYHIGRGLLLEVLRTDGGAVRELRGMLRDSLIWTASPTRP